MTADLYLRQMNIKSGGAYKETHLEDRCTRLEDDLHALWAGHFDVQVCGFVGGTDNWSQRE